MAKVKIVASLERKKYMIHSESWFRFGEEFPQAFPNRPGYFVALDMNRGNTFYIETTTTLAGKDKFEFDPSYFIAREEMFLADEVSCDFFKKGIELYPVQKKFVGFAMKHLYGRANANIWDKRLMPGSGIFNTSDPGTGKTPTTMAVCLKTGCFKNLIVAPLSLVPQWEAEIKKFLRPEFQGHVEALPRYQSHLRDKIIEGWKTQPYGWLIVGYAQFRIHADQLKSIGWDCCVLDESAAICNPKAEVTLSAIEFAEDWSSIPFIQCLNGTPIRNNAGEAWAQLITSRNLLVNGITHEDFFEKHTEKVSVQIEKGPRITKHCGIKAIKDYSFTMAQNMGRIARDSSLFPKTTENIVSLVLTEEEEKIYRALEFFGNQVRPGRNVFDILAEEGSEDEIREFAVRRKRLLGEEGNLSEFLDTLSTRVRDEEEFDTSELGSIGDLRPEDDILLDIERTKAKVETLKAKYSIAKMQGNKEVSEAILSEAKEAGKELRALEKELKESQDQILRLQRMIDVAARQERINTMQRLMRICGGYESVFDANGKRTFQLNLPRKMEWTKEFLLERESAGTQTVIFCIYNAEIDGITQMLSQDDVNIPFGVVRGDTLDVFDECEKFRNGEYSVLVVQQAKGDKGLNLQVARDCIFYSKGYSSEKFVQAKARVDRIGSKHDEVDYWYPMLQLSDGTTTMDGIVHAAVEGKVSLMKAVSVSTSSNRHIPDEVRDLATSLAESNPALLERLRGIFPDLEIKL